MTEENNNQDGKEKKNFFSELFDGMLNSRKDSIRTKIEAGLDDLKSQEPTEKEMATMLDQFSKHVSLQLLRLVAFKLYGDKANVLIGEVLSSFIEQGKQTLMVKHQIDSIEMQDSKLYSLVGEDLVEKERKLVAERVIKIYDQFEREMKEVLLIDEKDLPSSEDDKPEWE